MEMGVRSAGEREGGFKRNHRKARVITLLTFIGLSPISCAEVFLLLFLFKFSYYSYFFKNKIFLFLL